MANILLTDSCNRTCSFCFAQERLRRNRRTGERVLAGDSFLSTERFERILSMLEKEGGTRQLRLLGGEPSLHPGFADMVDSAIARGFHVLLFSNMILQERLVDRLAAHSPDRLSILANVTPESSDTARMKERAEAALIRLHAHTVVSLTIVQPDFRYRFLIDMIERLDLKRRIRVGIGMPIVGRDNSFLSTDLYKRVGSEIAAMALVCIDHSILLGFDCGLTMCMFTREEMGIISDCTEGLNIVCRPIIDVGPNGEVWHCFPLSEVLNTNIAEFEDFSAMRTFYQETVHPYRALGAMEECLACDYMKRGQCTGGCLAHTMRSLDRIPPREARARLGALSRIPPFQNWK